MCRRHGNIGRNNRWQRYQFNLECTKRNVLECIIVNIYLYTEHNQRNGYVNPDNE